MLPQSRILSYVVCSLLFKTYGITASEHLHRFEVGSQVAQIGFWEFLLAPNLLVNASGEDVRPRKLVSTYLSPHCVSHYI